MVLLGSASVTTTEAGGTASFTVALNGQPKADVVLPVASANTSEGVTSVTQLVFTPDNWSAPQAVTVTGQDDQVMDGDAAYQVTVGPASSDDETWAGQSATPVELVNTDDETAGAQVSTATGALTEAGGQSSFTVVLRAQPTADVTLPLSTSNANEAAVSPSALVFTAENWAAPQTVLVTGVDDSVADGNQAVSVLFGAMQSDDTGYAGMQLTSVGLVNIDDESPGVAVGQLSGAVTESGGQASFTVALQTEPAADVTVALSSSAADEATVAPANLTFTAVNWAAPQTVVITGVNDDLADGNQPVSIVFTALASADANYQGLQLAPIALVNVDDETAGITVTPLVGASSETGRSATVSVALNSQPTADVTIGLSVQDATEGAANLSELVFTASNWNAPQTISVVGVDDDLADGDQVYHLVFASTSSSDPAYDGVVLPSVALTNSDNEKAGFELSPPVGLPSELGASATFTVALQAQPAADVTLPMSSSDTTEGVVTPAQLVFTANNWSTPQTVTVTGQNDDLVDGNQVFRVDFVAATSADAAFNGLKPASPWFTNLDDDTAALVVTPITGSVSEAGTTATFTARLSAAPTADVTLPMSVSDATEAALSGTALVFSSTDWATPQTVTVTGLNDDVADGDQPFTVNFAPTDSTDGTFAGLVTLQLSSVNLDNDSAGYRITNASGALSEAGAEATATIALTSQPTANVTFSMSVDKPAEAAVLTGPLTFTPTSWATPQTITLKGLDEAIDDGDQVVKLSFSRPVSADDGYDSLMPSDVLFTNTDDDTAGITASPIADATAEDGSTTTFTVVLDSEPLADVIVSFDTSDPTEGTPDAIELLFDATSWSTPQTVTLSGVNDDVMDGDIAYTVDFTPSSSTDGKYDGLVPSPLSTTNLDDDVAGISVSTTTGTTTEAGGSFTFTVQLTSEPTADVAIDVLSTDTTEGSVNSSQLVFTPLTWNQPATVKVTGVDDTTVDGDVAYQVRFPATTSTDGNYDGMLATPIDAINLDNDVSGLVIKVEGHADIIAQCVGGDYSCQAKAVCEQVTGYACVHQTYDCYTGSQGSWYPQDGVSGGSNFNFAYTYDLAGGNYGNICACTLSQMSRYGLAANHSGCGYGHWTRVP